MSHNRTMLQRLWIYQFVLFIYILILLCTLNIGIVESSSADFYITDAMRQQSEPIDEDELDEEYVKNVEEQILKLLGLPQTPRPASHHLRTKAAPQFMMHLYQEVQRQEGMNDALPTGSPTATGPELRNLTRQRARIDPIENADIVISFINKVASNKVGISHEEDRRLYFELDDVTTASDLADAELRLYKRASKHTSASYFLSVFRLDSPARRDQDDFGLTFIDTLVVNDSYEGWLLFNVTETLQSWLDHPAENNGLFIQVMSTQGDDILPHRIGIANRHSDDDKQGFMVAFFNALEPLSKSVPRLGKPKTTPSRKKRAVNSPAEDNYWENPASVSKYSRKLCQRKQLMVKFKRLRFDSWIIAPEGYPAFYCEGECSFPLHAHMNATNHAIVQTLVSLIHPTKYPKACCAPKKLSAITVLFFDETQNVVMKRYRNMVVQSCGCH